MKKVIILIAGTASTLLSMPAIAGTLAVDQAFVFGTSLSDSGNFWNITAIPPSPVYFEGRFSNGRNWIDYLAEDLGLNLTRSTELIPGNGIPNDGINFALGAAKTDNTNLVPGLPPLPGFPGIQNQVDYFVSLLGGGTINNPKALAIVEGGANDFFGGQTDPQIPVDNLTGEIQQLIDAGLTNILVVNMPDLGNTPVGLNTNPSGLTQLAIDFNNRLDLSINQLKLSNTNVNFFRFDFYNGLNQWLTNPAQFGFTNVTQGCTNIVPIRDFGNTLPDPLYNPSCSSDLAVQDQFAFYDDQHPTTAIHRLMADSALQALQVPETSPVWGLGLLGLGFLINRTFSAYSSQKKSQKIDIEKNPSSV